MVSPASKVHEAGEPTMSLETMGSSVYSSTRSSGGLAAASAKAALTSATDGLPCTTAVKSVMEPAGTGTRSDVPVEAALHGRQHQAGGPGRAGRGRHDVDRRRPGPGAGPCAAGRAGSGRWCRRAPSS